MSIVRCRYPPLPLVNQSLLEYITADFHKRPNKVAMIDSVTKTAYDFATVKESYEKVAAAWRQDGMKKGDIVCIHSTNCPEYIFAFLAALRIGAIPTTSNPAYTTRELVTRFVTANTDYLVTSSSLLDVADAASKSYGKLKRTYVIGDKGQSDHISFESLLSYHGDTFGDEITCDPDEVAMLIHSSGTTGLPKGVMLTHRNIATNLRTILLDYPWSFLKSDDRLLAFLPFYHIFGLLLIATGSLKMGGTVIVEPHFVPDTFFQQIEEFKITRLIIPPPVGVILAKHPRVKDTDFSSVVDILSGAAPLGEETENEIAENTGIRPRQGYGMTELTGVVTILPKEDASRKLGSVGLLLQNTEAKVLDVETNNLLGPNEIGELYFRGPQVMKGYYGNPQATNECIDAQGWMRTGDIGYYDEEEYFYIVDRLKEIIKYKGHQVAPAELESVLLTMDAIADVAVIGKPDEFSGELPMAFVVKKQGASVTENDVVEFLEDKVAPQKRLRGGVVFIDSVPKTQSGKILRQDLRQRFKKS